MNSKRKGKIVEKTKKKIEERRSLCKMFAEEYMVKYCWKAFCRYATLILHNNNKKKVKKEREKSQIYSTEIYKMTLGVTTNNFRQ